MSDQKIRELERKNASGELADLGKLQRARERVDPVVALDAAFELVLVTLEGLIRERLRACAERTLDSARAVVPGFSSRAGFVEGFVGLHELFVQEVVDPMRYVVVSMEPEGDLWRALTTPADKVPVDPWHVLTLDRLTGTVWGAVPRIMRGVSPPHQVEPLVVGHLLDKHGGREFLGPFGASRWGILNQTSPRRSRAQQRWNALAAECRASLRRPINSTRVRPRGSATSEGETSQAAHERAVSPGPGSSQERA